MIDMRRRMPGEVVGEEIDHRFKRAALLVVVVGPFGTEQGIICLPPVNAPEIFEAVRVQRIAFKVEEQVGCVRTRQTGKPARRLRVEGLHDGVAGPPCDLKSCLRLQARERVGRELWDP